MSPTRLNHLGRSIICAGLIGLASLGLHAEESPKVEPSSNVPTHSPEPGIQTGILERDGVKVEFKISSLETRKDDRALQAGDFAEVQFSISSTETGEPIRNSYPGVWIDIVETADGHHDGSGLECKTRIGMYLQGMVGIRPLIDLNSYYVLVLNREPSISVIDPVVGISGITSLFTTINLKRPGADWAKTPDENWMFVSMPRADEVAVVNLGTFKVHMNIPTGDYPNRVRMQPDARYVWVGNTGKKGVDGSVTVINTRSFEVAANIPLGQGHHEIAFSDNSRFAYLTNRESGTVTVIDTTTLSVHKVLETGPLPIALAYSKLSKSLYVGDGESGDIQVYDAATLKNTATIKTDAGMGPMKFSNDGRWAFTANPANDTVYIIDAATNQVAHKVIVAGKPYKLGITDSFAYVRVLEENKVTMINLLELGKGGKPVLNHFDAGSVAPSKAADISIADAISPAALAAAVMVVSPGDSTIYYYMEGMNAPSGAFRNYGASPRAVGIADRAMKELRPGVYSSKVRIPEAGKFEFGFMNETPRFLNCFEVTAGRNLRNNEKIEPRYVVDYTLDERRIPAGDTVNVKFQVRNEINEKIMSSTDQVLVKYYRAPRFNLKVLPAESLGDGQFEVKLPMQMAGAYYIQIAVPSLNLDYNDLNLLTVMAVDPAKLANEKKAK